MINVLVSYTVKPEYVEDNKTNIKKFLEDFKQLDQSKFEYKVYLKEDGITFLHYSNYENEEMQYEVLNVPSFKEFQRLRDESGLNGSHQVNFYNQYNKNRIPAGLRLTGTRKNKNIMEEQNIWWLNEESEQMLNRGYLLKGETVKAAIERITTAAAKDCISQNYNRLLKK